MSEVVNKRAKNAHVFDRAGEEWYQEPTFVTENLLKVERFIGSIFDPACGQGNIVKTLVAAGLQAKGSDIVCRVPDRPIWFWRELDFLEDGDALAGCVNIVTNPPFFRAIGTEAFVRKALAIATGKVAIFADYRFLMSGKRARGLFKDCPPTRVWLCADRPSCPPGEWIAAGNKPGGGTADYAWLVWDLTAPSGETRLGWLR